MAKIIGALAIGLAGVLLWRLVVRRPEQSALTDHLRSAIERSNLPERAREEMQLLLDQRRTRPSQFDEKSA